MVTINNNNPFTPNWTGIAKPSLGVWDRFYVFLNNWTMCANGRNYSFFLLEFCSFRLMAYWDLLLRLAFPPYVGPVPNRHANIPGWQSSSPRASLWKKKEKVSFHHLGTLVNNHSWWFYTSRWYSIHTGDNLIPPTLLDSTLLFAFVATLLTYLTPTTHLSLFFFLNKLQGPLIHLFYFIVVEKRSYSIVYGNCSLHIDKTCPWLCDSLLHNAIIAAEPQSWQSIRSY